MDFKVESLYGVNTKQGLLHIEWGDLNIQVTILEAKKIAHMLLEAAEGAVTDEVIFENANVMGLEMAAQIVTELRARRPKYDLRLFEN